MSRSLLTAERKRFSVQVPLQEKNDKIDNCWSDKIACSLGMEPFKAVTYYGVGKLLAHLAAMHGSKWRLGEAFYGEMALTPRLDEPASQDQKVDLQLIVAAIRVECSRIKLVRSTEYADDILRQLKEQGTLANRQIATLLTELDKHIRWDMEKEMFMYIPAERATYFHNRTLLCPAAMNNFPASSEEIMLSGDCYAAGCWTASVTHSMRSLEKPIHAVADAIGGIKLPKEIEVTQWGVIHREIDNKVKALREIPLSVARDEDIAFYSNLNLEFGYFNDVWRRFVAHSRKSYDEPQAKSAMKHVIEFIDSAAQKGLKEQP